MGKQAKSQTKTKDQPEKQQKITKHKNTKVNRFQDIENDQPLPNNKKTWPTNAVVYIGHLPHGFFENQLKQYFSQYGDVLGVKVARSKKTARSKGYAFVQFKYAEIAEIVANTMNGYMLMGKVLISNQLPENGKNPFHFSSSKQFKFINFKKLFIKKTNQVKDDAAVKKSVQNLLQKEAKKREYLKQCGIQYDYPGFSALLK